MTYQRLILRKCPKEVLNTLPENMEVRGDLWIGGGSYNKDIISLPVNLKISGTLDLRECTSLESLPEGLKVGGWLSLDRCTRIDTFPKVLKVGICLSLDRCLSIEYLPEELKVGSLLDLLYCISLRKIPENIEVGHRVMINPDVSEGTGVRKEDFPERLWDKIL